MGAAVSEPTLDPQQFQAFREVAREFVIAVSEALEPVVQAVLDFIRALHERLTRFLLSLRLKRAGVRARWADWLAWRWPRPLLPTRWSWAPIRGQPG